MSKYSTGVIESFKTIEAFGSKVVALIEAGYKRITSFGTKLLLGKTYKAEVIGYRVIPLTENATGEKKLLTLYELKVAGLADVETMIAGESSDKLLPIGTPVTIEAVEREGKKYVQFATTVKPELQTADEVAAPVKKATF